MKLILFILLLFTFTGNAQFGNRNFFGETPSAFIRQNLIMTADANSGTLPSPFDVQCFGAPGSISQSNDLSATQKAYKFVVGKTDVQCANGRRAELNNFSDVLVNGYQGYDRWIGFKIYIPGSWTFETNPILTNILHQWHDNEQGSETGYKSAFEFVISTNKWAYNVRACANETGSGFFEQFRPMELYNPTIIRDVWHDIVIHLVFQSPATAQAYNARVEIWINGTKATDYTGLMGFNHTYSPFPKVGNYAWAWNNDNLACCGDFTVVTQRTHYVNFFRLGNQNATYNDVAPDVSQ